MLVSDLIGYWVSLTSTLFSFLLLRQLHASYKSRCFWTGMWVCWEESWEWIALERGKECYRQELCKAKDLRPKLVWWVCGSRASLLQMTRGMEETRVFFSRTAKSCKRWKERQSLAATWTFISHWQQANISKHFPSQSESKRSAAVQTRGNWYLTVRPRKRQPETVAAKSGDSDSSKARIRLRRGKKP